MVSKHTVAEETFLQVKVYKASQITIDKLLSFSGRCEFGGWEERTRTLAVETFFSLSSSSSPPHDIQRSPKTPV